MIIITGQTGTGKTSRALKLATENNGELISVDSRQIYNEMDIGTGKIDSPNDLKQINSIWHLRGIPIYGINLINPDRIFSAGDFAEYGKEILRDMKRRGKVPILVGGTGFYIKSLIDPDETVFIPQNKELRDVYETKSVGELQKDLALKDTEKFESMNNSDVNNPRRLIRALEVVDWKSNHGVKTSTKNQESTIQWIGLTASKEILLDRISQRIDQMIRNGLEEEVRTLYKKYGWNTAGLQTIGYKEWKSFFEESKSIADVKNDIITSHLQYARKQMIYFKRFDRIKWISITEQVQPQ